MALPKLNEIRYELEIPSTGEKIDYRPFLMKEQKILMMAEESDDAKQIQKAFGDIVETCTFGKIDPYKYPLFDLEYIFLQMRSKSVGAKVELMIPVPDSEETVKKTVNLEEVDVVVDEEHTNEIEVQEDVKLVMGYPTLSNMAEVDAVVDNPSAIFELIKACIFEIHHGEEIINRVDVSDNELDEFIDSMNNEQIEGIDKFFRTMPKLSHTIKFQKDNEKHEVELAGLQSFFG